MSISMVLIFGLFLTFSSSFAIQNGVKNGAYYEYAKTLTSKDSAINFRYNRNSLKVYSYSNTNSVNLYISDAKIHYEPSIENIAGLDERDIEIIGVANLVTSHYRDTLKDCAFFVVEKQTGRIYKDQSHQIIKRFLNTELCPSIGYVNAADLSLAHADPRDFGPISIKLSSVQDKFPQLTVSEPSEPDFEERFDRAAKRIVKEVGLKFLEENGGKIMVPSYKYNMISAQDGTFDGLGNLQKKEGIKVQIIRKKKTVRFFFSFAVAKGKIVSRNLNRFSRLPYDALVCGDVTDLVYNVGISVGHKENGKCAKSIVNFGVQSLGSQSTYDCKSSNYIDNHPSKAMLNNNALDDVVLRTIEKELMKKVQLELRKIECENLRLSRYYF